MSNYQNGKIYSIRSYQTDLIYIGSTTQSLSKRLGKHRQYVKNKKISSGEILKYPDYYIELIENFPCNSREELHKQEGYHIRKNINICVNCCIAGRTKKEYNNDNKEKIKESQKIYKENNKEKIIGYRKQYLEDNKEKIKESQKKYREDNKERIRELRRKNYEDNKEKIKKYQEDNKEHIKEYQKKYREDNKSQLNIS